MQNYTFFAMIIGTEILNRRREDKHFDYVTNALAEKGYKLKGSFIIEDDPQLIVDTIQFIANQPNTVLLSFGGIGSTPDDHTRKCAAVALRDGTLPLHHEAAAVIKEALGERVSPHSLHMAELPTGSDIIENPVNKMPAFSLDQRFYFMPGFPQMSHPMVSGILDRLLPESKTYHRYTLTAECRESLLIEVMEKMPEEVEFSSLPKHYEGVWRVSVSVASHDHSQAKKAFKQYVDFLNAHEIHYSLEDDA